MATRLSGSSDLYQPSGRRPYHSINFITSHDGFPLNDLVSYERKHNLGEPRRQPRRRQHQQQQQLRRRRPNAPQKHRRRCGNVRRRTSWPRCCLSQGVPMILARRRSPPHAARQQQRLLPGQRQSVGSIGSWWRTNAEMLRFVQSLIAFRRRQPNVRRGAFLTGKATQSPASCQTSAGISPDGNADQLERQRSEPHEHLRHQRPHRPGGPPVMIMLHAGTEPRPVHDAARPAANIKWRLFIDTAAEPPDDIYPEADGPLLGSASGRPRWPYSPLLRSGITARRFASAATPNLPPQITAAGIRPRRRRQTPLRIVGM